MAKRKPNKDNFSIYHNQILAINSITGHGDTAGWCPNTQLIVTCDFISDNNLDEKFDNYLKEKIERDKKLSTHLIPPKKNTQKKNIIKKKNPLPAKIFVDKRNK